MPGLPSAPGSTLACSFWRLGLFSLATAGPAASDDAPAPGDAARRLRVGLPQSALRPAREAAGRASCRPRAARGVAAQALPSCDASRTCAKHASFVSGVRSIRGGCPCSTTHSSAGPSFCVSSHRRPAFSLPLLQAHSLFTCCCFAAAISSHVVLNILRVQRVSACCNLFMAAASTIGCWSEPHT